MSKTSRFSDGRRRLLAALPALALVGVLGGALTLGTGSALAADPLDAPRDKGIVGERVDGYAAVREPDRADAAIRTLVTEINAKRKAFYARRADEEGVSVEAIAKIYAKKIYEKAPKGWWFRAEDGRWVQK